MSSKQPKTVVPTDADLKGNPMINGSIGSTGVSADDMAELQGENTIEGDTMNDTNTYGGINGVSGTGRRKEK